MVKFKGQISVFLYSVYPGRSKNWKSENHEQPTSLLKAILTFGGEGALLYFSFYS